MSENRAFTDRCIAKLQRLSITDGAFVQAGTEYLIGHGRIAYDFGRNLFWALPPSGSPQVAVWMMPVCSALEGEQA